MATPDPNTEYFDAQVDAFVGSASPEAVAFGDVLKQDHVQAEEYRARVGTLEGKNATQEKQIGDLVKAVAALESK